MSQTAREQLVPGGQCVRLFLLCPRLGGEKRRRLKIKAAGLSCATHRGAALRRDSVIVARSGESCGNERKENLHWESNVSEQMRRSVTLERRHLQCFSWPCTVTQQRQESQKTFVTQQQKCKKTLKKKKQNMYSIGLKHIEQLSSSLIWC